MLFLLLLNLPAVQQSMSVVIANQLENILQTKVSVGNINPGLLNRIIIDDIVIKDQQNKDLLTIARLAVKIDIIPLFRGQISIANIQMFSFKINAYQERGNQPLNYQFIIDKLASKTSKKENNIKLRINAILLRRGEICFNKNYEPETPGIFNEAHICLKDISTNISLKAFHKDSINLAVKRLSFKEQSGLTIKNLRLKFTANQKKASLAHFALEQPNSCIYIDSLTAYYSGNPLSISSDTWKRTLQIKGNINKSTINLKDLSYFIPAWNNIDIPLHYQAAFSYCDQTATLNNILIYTENKEFALNAQTVFRPALGENQAPLLTAQIQDLKIEPSVTRLLRQIQFKESDTYLKLIEQSGTNHLKIDFRYDQNAQANINLENKCGRIFLSALMDKHHQFRGRIRTDNFNLHKLDSLDLNIGKVGLNVSLNGTWDSKKAIKDFQVSGKINQFEFKKYNYQNIQLNIRHTNNRFSGNLGMNDPNGTFLLEGLCIKANQKLKAEMKVLFRNFSPNALNLTEKLKNTTFSAQLATDFTWKSIDQITGNLNLTDLTIKNDSLTKTIKKISLTSTEENQTRKILLASDFMNAQIEGTFKIKSLMTNLKQTFLTYLPSLRSDSTINQTNIPNNLTIRININDTDLLSQLLNLPLSVTKPAYFYGVYRSNPNNIQINCAVPELRYNTHEFKNISLNCIGNKNVIQGNFALNKKNTNSETLVRVKLNAGQDAVNTSIKWFSPDNNIFNGNFEFKTSFQKNISNKTNTIVQILPSQFTLDNTTWNVHASCLDITPEKIRIEDFLIEQPEKHFEIGGIVSANPKDSIVADLKNIDLQYIFNLIDFEAVQFDGHATGKVFANDLLGNPNIKTLLDIPDFKLNNGKMGSLNIFGKWELESKSIYLNAMMNDPLNESITRVAGQITPGRGPGSGLNLNIMANRTNLYFLNKYTNGIFTNLQGRATGHARVFGPFHQINLEGDLLVNEADMKIDILNTHYRLYNDSVILRPNNIWFYNADIYDDYGYVGSSGHYALIDGHLQHENFSNLSYDISINAQNILGYDQRNFGDDVFCGTAFATGKAHIYGRPGLLNVDLNIHPEENTIFTYNLSSPDVISETPFIRFIDKDTSATDTTQTQLKDMLPETADMAPVSDIHINFQLDITPKATMKILMDARSGDYISLNGYGNMRATYYNKGKFQLYGTARINEGVYKLSLQDVIKKEFQLTPGGTVTFGGDPAEAELNLQAVYTVPSVSLNDLNPQGNFSQSNVRVNCLMNLTGKARQPHITFDFDIPNVNEDEKQMVKTLISTEEEKNLQTIYLLGIGRFYGYNYNATQQNQSSLAMNSLLSSTLSGQLNEMLSNIIGSNNWNFGTNLSTGEEGWSDMDIEGLLSGKLLNNRLLINGNFGYKENATLNKSSNFIGDFDVQWLLTKSGNIRLKGYSETNDRYFTKSSLTTQGIGLQLKKDFSSWRELFNLKPKAAKPEEKEEEEKKEAAVEH